MRTAAVLAALIVILASPAARACYEPTAPYCATKYGAFDDQDEFDRCKREMNSYKSDAKSS